MVSPVWGALLPLPRDCGWQNLIGVFHHVDCFVVKWQMFQEQSPSGLFPFEEQQFTVPQCVAKALNELHTTVVLQVLPGMFCYVPSDL